MAYQVNGLRNSCKGVAFALAGGGKVQSGGDLSLVGDRSSQTSQVELDASKLVLAERNDGDRITGAEIEARLAQLKSD